MSIHNSPNFKKSALYIALTSALTISTPTMAENASVEGIERISVTASRRASSVQETPVNITALDGDVMKDQNINQLSDVARWVPGLSVPDQGGRSGSSVIVRGLNTNSSGPDSDGGTVAIYAGEIPLFVDMKLIDIQRVEVLIGPQGTLYGAGTLGGAIRYLPNKPVLDETSGSIYGDVFSLSESSSVGGEAGFVFNTPLIDDTLGFRMAFNQLDEPGYVDYGYVLREGGSSLPDPDWSNDAEVNTNLKKVKDVNFEETSTARLMLRWTPTDYLDTTLSYFYQKQKVGGRSIVHYDSLSDSNPLLAQVGKYESAYRYEEPQDRKDSLISLEITADLGFAELTSATGYSEFEESGQRDQTDLLIRLDYSYEEFPAFSTFTREDTNSEVLTQEIRLVSTSDSAFNWIVGGYYNNFKTTEGSLEYTPGFDQYAVDNWDANKLRPDALEYISIINSEITEQAVFGELTYQATEQLSLTFGARYYEYKVASDSAVDLPLYYTLFGDYAADEINLDFKEVAAKDDGNLLKFNVSYQFNEDILSYLTISDGFRIGGSNGVAECPDNIDELENQIVCALPNEVTYEADTTTNYELGFKSSWFRNKLHFNAAVFMVEWDNAQVGGATLNGQQPITANAATAKASGIEISTRAMLAENLTGFATYAQTKAELTDNAPYLFGVFGEQGSELQNYYDGASGDRLPGSPEQQFSLGLKYSTELFDKALDINYGLTYQSDVYTKLGLKADGEKLPGYALSNVSAQLADDNWSVTLYIDNLFDKYAFSSVRRDKGDIGMAQFPEMNSNDPALQRNYGHYLVTPRKIGLRFEYMFDM